MKSLVLLLTSIMIFLIGIIFRMIPIPGAGILLVIGLALFIAYATARYIQSRSPVMRKVLIISSGVLLASLIFAMIRNKYFAELLIGAVILGLLIFLLILLFGNSKKSNSNSADSF